MAIKRNVEKEANKVVEEPKVEVVEEVKEEPKGKIYTTTTVVNFRAKSNLNAKVIKILQSDVEVNVFEIKNGWASVELDGTKGYIMADYIRQK